MMGAFGGWKWFWPRNDPSMPGLAAGRLFRALEGHGGAMLWLPPRWFILLAMLADALELDRII